MKSGHTNNVHWIAEESETSGISNLYIAKLNRSSHEFQKKVFLCEVYIEVDGYYVASFSSTTGCFSSEMLKTVALILDELNQEWDSKVKAELSAK